MFSAGKQFHCCTIDPLVLGSALQGSRTSWPGIFTSRLNDKTRLVGPVISCQTIEWPKGIPDIEAAENIPHLSHEMFAFDKVTALADTAHPSLPTSAYYYQLVDGILQKNCSSIT